MPQNPYQAPQPDQPIPTCGGQTKSGSIVLWVALAALLVLTLWLLMIPVNPEVRQRALEIQKKNSEKLRDSADSN